MMYVVYTMLKQLPLEDDKDVCPNATGYDCVEWFISNAVQQNDETSFHINVQLENCIHKVYGVTWRDVGAKVFWTFEI
jgi:hypothetical protein